MTPEEKEILKSVIREELVILLSEDMGIDIEGDGAFGDEFTDVVSPDEEIEEESDEEEDVEGGSEAAPKRKRVVRKGVLKYKMTCPKGWSWDRHKGICVLPPRSTQIKRSRASKRGSRKRKAFAGRIAKSRSKAMRKLRKPLKKKRS